MARSNAERRTEDNVTEARSLTKSMSPKNRHEISYIPNAARKGILIRSANEIKKRIL
jgi:hypothetical protein